MVSKESLRKFSEDLGQYMRENPRAGLRQSIQKSASLTKKALEADISWATAPSMFVPMPEGTVQQLRRRLKQ